jgi:hypothetical protein
MKKMRSLTLMKLMMAELKCKLMLLISFRGYWRWKEEKWKNRSLKMRAWGSKLYPLYFIGVVSIN